MHQPKETDKVSPKAGVSPSQIKPDIPRSPQGAMKPNQSN